MVQSGSPAREPRLPVAQAKLTMAEGAAVGSRPPAVKDYGYRVSCSFDGGNIQLLDIPDPHTVNLAIRPDPYCMTDSRAHYQWFSFRLSGARGAPLQLRLTNAAGASYGTAWEGYRACASYDMQDWFRVPTSYDAQSGVLTISHTPDCDAVHYAYWAPYPMERHASLVARLQAAGVEGAAARVRLHVLGSTLDGRDLDCLQVSANPSDPEVPLGTPLGTPSLSAASPAPGAAGPRVWVIARQHPGESMAEWYAEGLLERLTDPADPVARSLLLNKHATFYVVPCMCPDGAARGHLRTNALGTNLNRAWAAPSLAASPEVLHTLAAIDRTGVDLFLDVHGDEELPHVFIAGLEGIPAWRDGPRLANLQGAFCDAYRRHAPEFQTEHGYPPNVAGSANLTVASKQIGQRHNCLALTLEMPFKDSALLPDPRVGWSPQRAKRLGAALLGAVHDIAHLLH